jgi:hypothetical protein
MNKNIVQLFGLAALALTSTLTSQAFAAAFQSRLMVTVTVVSTCNIPNMQLVLTGPKTATCLPAPKASYIEAQMLPIFNMSVDEQQVTYTF